MEAVRKYPDRFRIMGWFYLDDPQGRDLLAHCKERSGMVGLRFYFNERHKREWMTEGTLDWLWPTAERAGVPRSSSPRSDDWNCPSDPTWAQQ